MKIHPRRGLRTMALAVLATIAAGGTALAAITAKPEKGKTYSGFIRRSATVKTPISFRVSKNGKTVSDFKFAYPVFCQGGGFPIMKSRSTSISKKGTFTAKLPLKGQTGKPEGHVTVTGKFAKGGKEKGKVTTDIKGVATCNGTSPYSTKAK